MIARTRLAVALLLAAPIAPAAASNAARSGVPGHVVLDGLLTEVRWTDGDGFQPDSGPLRGLGVRLRGYNALETHGPVHRIAGMEPAALEAIATSTAALLAATTWRCATVGRRDGYGRPLVDCPEAAARAIREGHAMVFAVGARPDPRLLALQREAQAAGRGLWARGVPPLVITSLHAEGEPGLRGRSAYDRLVDTRTGRAQVRRHRTAYAVCQEVCVGEGASSSCMVYVPFERRHHDRPACLEPRRDR